MTVSVTSALSATQGAAVILFLTAEQAAPTGDVFAPLAPLLASGFINRKHLNITPVPAPDAFLMVVGLGDAADFRPARLKQAAGAAVRFLNDRGVQKAVFVTPDAPGVSPEHAAAMLARGAVLGHYDAGLYKSTKRPERVETLEIVSSHADAPEAARRAAIVAEAANLARDLVNTPANELPPLELARRAEAAGREAGLNVEVLTLEDIERLGMAGIIAVNQGSGNPPSFTVMKHMPNPGEAPVVLVGKGITFDTGGISIKPGSDMHHMKGDMGGAAAVVGAMVAVGRLNLPRNVVGLIPSAENMPDGRAYRPSDVLTYANGKTVEITNTDAEGRLILADALIYGEREFQPRAMLDAATLTGSCVVALGNDIAGIFTDDDGLSDGLYAAADAVDEPVWRLPLYHPYRPRFDSGTADMLNAGDRWGGSITAALFLAEFVDNVPWVHLDIAGPAFDDTDKAYLARGGTGYGVQLFVQFLENLA